MTHYEKYSLVIGVFAVLATLSAVTVAIWGESVRRRISIPNLELALDEPALTRITGGPRGWYYMLRVHNKRQTYPATNVRVVLNRIFKNAPDGSWQEQRFSGPTQVMWRWPNQMPLYATVGPDEIATFGYLNEGAEAFGLQLYHYPNNLQRSISSGEPTRLEFRVVSDTAQSKAITIEIAWDGEWTDGHAEMHDHLVVKQIAE